LTIWLVDWFSFTNLAFIIYFTWHLPLQMAPGQQFFMMISGDFSVV